ncbi:molybdenum ABC transporter ATP-binding protein [Sphingomonas spermidinifaciens]|uniref:Molybdenum ABC transporter ATP-binding protein n=1 Tax=Sphingomonas spermidinifaciens TaxID=1141889 RepID=A0A2A4B6M6_9SPHN|nr:ATP-binding cassette domain-containing protein [Sphingomonas spermidinifaciens]PCD03439.1 molybdenum ABC transporter ATP-binding protein [Sphingomonas spermidinifaciens]
MSFDLSLVKRRGDTLIAAHVEGGEGVTVLFGPSGAGKTSVLDMVAGLLRPDEGHVRVDGVTLFDRAARIDLPPERRRAGYVFQDGRLFPHLSVGANLRYGERRAPPEARWIGFEAVVDLLGIGHLLARRPRTLSGGEARRVAIGRALLAAPRFLLLDEPTSFLDRARREEVARAIEDVRDRLKLPILLVTHDQGEAERLGTRIVRM